MPTNIPGPGEFWITADGSEVLVTHRASNGLCVSVIKPAGSAAAGGGYITDWNGKVFMLEPGPHPLHLVKPRA